MRRHRPTPALLAAFALLAASTVAGGSRPNDQTEAPRPRFAATTEVVASRLTSDPVAAGRREVVVTRDEIEALPVADLQQLLALLPGIGLARRGARGVQGDLNLRGATFEQAVVMVNGIRVSNPQTGHHDLDLFIPLAAIERVEVLYGPGSAVHGPDAFGGAVNIVTASPPRSAHLRLGEHHLSGGGFAGPLGDALWLALERQVDTGYRDNTEAEHNQAAGGWSWHRGRRRLDLTLAAGRRRFGAEAFYSQRFPDQREQTSGRLATLRLELPLGATTLRLGLRADRHRDDFVLDRARPEWYHNRHRTSGRLADLVLSGQATVFDWAAGVELARDEIDSSSLGRHHRSQAAAFAELGRFSGPRTISLQLRHDRRQGWGSVTTAAAGGSWRLAPRLRLRAAWGESFRPPSYTELYYRSPATVGDPGLGPERGRTAELGLDGGAWGATVFERRTSDLIDFVLGDDEVWRARNLGQITTRGLELEARLPVRGHLRWQRLGLSYLDSEVAVDPARSRYALAHPRLEAAWTGAAELGLWRLGWSGRFREPRERGSWAIVNLSLGRRILKGMHLELEVANALDREVAELPWVPLPGRWASLVVRYQEEGR